MVQGEFSGCPGYVSNSYSDDQCASGCHPNPRAKRGTYEDIHYDNKPGEFTLRGQI